MRLVAWNTNYNVKKRSLEGSVELLSSLCADVIVLSETAPPAAGNPLGAQMTGGAPGLAVIARPGLTLFPHPKNERASTLTAGYWVAGDLDFALVAVWPVRNEGPAAYTRVLLRVAGAGRSGEPQYPPRGRLAASQRPLPAGARYPGRGDGRPRIAPRPAVRPSGLIAGGVTECGAGDRPNVRQHRVIVYPRCMGDTWTSIQPVLSARRVSARYPKRCSDCPGGTASSNSTTWSSRTGE